MAPQPVPAVFFGHGSPMNALERNRYTEAWRAFGASIPAPRAVLMVSAHWYINATAVTAMPAPRTIHDFYGFPDELFAVDYPAPGDPELAQEVAELVKPVWVGADHDSWGLDHGTWSVLAHAFPGADVPVVQLAVNAMKPLEYHLDLGARLAPLRERGILIAGSGNVVHNLGRVDMALADRSFPWAERFGEAAVRVLSEAPDTVVGLEHHPDFRAAAPTPDHFIPLLYVAGVAAAAGCPVDVLVDGYAYGSVSMASYTVGSAAPAGAAGDVGAPPVPDPTVVPADDTNM
ncbi:MAG TPA: 4,5-DOPA dioxygenase extradiol [Acidimicrobiales bacterium]|nr:4,5-DOPA dioxygenase extradiol [Acidimicrobiales bacterium]